MSEPRPLDPEKMDRLKAKFEAMRAREASTEKTAAPAASARERERPLTREAARAKARERDQGLGE